LNADVWPKAGVCPKAGAAPNGLEEPKVEPAGVAVLVLPKILPPLDVVAVEDDPNIFVAVDPKAGLVSTLPKGLACCPKVEPKYVKYSYKYCKSANSANKTFNLLFSFVLF